MWRTYFTLPRGGSDAVAAGEGFKASRFSRDLPSPLVPRDPPGGRVKSKVSGIGQAPPGVFPKTRVTAGNCERLPPHDQGGGELVGGAVGRNDVEGVAGDGGVVQRQGIEKGERLAGLVADCVE